VLSPSPFSFPFFSLTKNEKEVWFWDYFIRWLEFHFVFFFLISPHALALTQEKDDFFILSHQMQSFNFFLIFTTSCIIIITISSLPTLTFFLFCVKVLKNGIVTSRNAGSHFKLPSISQRLSFSPPCLQTHQSKVGLVFQHVHSSNSSLSFFFFSSLSLDWKKRVEREYSQKAAIPLHILKDQVLLSLILITSLSLFLTVFFIEVPLARSSSDGENCSSSWKNANWQK